MDEFEVKCPVCGHEIIGRRYFECGIGEVESHEKCERCNAYSYDYVYGVSELFIGKKVFRWSWTSNGEELSLINKRIAKMEYSARRNWKKHHSIYKNRKDK